MLDQSSIGRVSGNYFGIAETVGNAELIKCGDLFAGAGGFSLAAQNIGIDVRFSVELERHACATYRANLVREDWPKVYEANIDELSPKDVKNECLGSDEELDLILGGPPCQGFSVHRLKDSGKGDPRNLLIHKYFEFVSYFKPRAFIMENVPGMLWERHSSYVEKFYEEASSSGYEVQKPIVLEAADFGVPQKRKRVFVLGIKSGSGLDIDWPPSGGFVQSPKTRDNTLPWRAAKEVFSVPLDARDPNGLHMNHSSEMIEVFRATPKNGGSRKDSGRMLPCHEKHDGHKDVYGRIDPKKPGPTMTTACINPSKGRFVHPTKNHGITLRHAARFQTFPDNFIFGGGLIASGVQIGNAVPILLGEAVLRPLAEALAKK